MKYKVIDNFLSEEEFFIAKLILAEDFPWFCNPVLHDRVLKNDLYNMQFEHWFYLNYGFSSNYKHLIFPILEKLNILCILKIKANLLPVTEKVIEHGFHVDSPCSKNMKTAIFYLNTNNGKTVFKENEKIEHVESVENRIVIFDTSLLHTGTTCTDEKRRVVINFNFFEKNIEV